MISDLQRANKYKTYSRLWGYRSRIQIPRRRIKDKDAKAIATVAVLRSATSRWQLPTPKLLGQQTTRSRPLQTTAICKHCSCFWTEILPKFNKRRSSDESSGDDTPHHTHLELTINMSSDLVREREPDLELDESKTPVPTVYIRGSKMQVTTINH